MVPAMSTISIVLLTYTSYRLLSRSHTNESTGDLRAGWGGRTMHVQMHYTSIFPLSSKKTQDVFHGSQSSIAKRRLYRHSQIPGSLPTTPIINLTQKSDINPTPYPLQSQSTPNSSPSSHHPLTPTPSQSSQTPPSTSPSDSAS